MQSTDKYSRVKYEKIDQIAYVTLDRPRVLNAMDLQMHAELKLIWDDFEADENIRIGVITGAGDKAFSVGQDLKELALLEKEGKMSEASFGSRGKSGWPRLTERFQRTKPLIAKVQGYAFGGGFELALACDIIVASDNARFALPEAKLGLIPGAGGVFRLTRQLPARIALGYLMTGREISATKAFELGLINDVVKSNQLDACVNLWIADILRCAPLSIQSIKTAVEKSAGLTLEEAFSLTYPAEDIRKKSVDAKEGPQAFMEKRPPIWQGR